MFLEERLEFNYLPKEQKELPIFTSIFTPYGKAIAVMEISDDEKILMFGSNSGLFSILDFNGEKININNNLFLHSGEITSIFINNNLNILTIMSKCYQNDKR